MDERSGSDNGGTVAVDESQLVQLESRAASAGVAAGVVHEVRNAMTGILGFAQVGQRRLEEGRPLGDLLALVERESKRCLELLGAYLSLTRAGRPAPEPVETDLNAMISLVGRMLREPFNQAGVSLRLQLAAELPALRCHPDGLQQVLLNLALNALAFSRAGDEVQVSSAADGGALLVRVRDLGPGVPAEMRERVFEPFYTTRQGSGGTGLGLWLSRHIVSQHRGSIEIEEVEGPGTSVCVRLPLDGEAAR